ncbi:MAG: hypothetical protein H0Z31_13770 [Bacillus sp. (in: Bacteria)]|nr:hypothetical protein [Bacillus sp. (in: firmicutes)]
MRLVYYEMKKLFNWKNILLIILINIVMNYLFIDFHIKHFPNGRPILDEYHLSKEMIEKYGVSIDEKEFTDLKKWYENMVKQADQYIQSREDFAHAGIRTYEDFRTADHSNDELRALHSQVMFTEQVDLFWKLEALEYIMGQYEKRDRWIKRLYEEVTPKQEEKINQIIDSGTNQSILPWFVFENYNHIIKNVTIIIIVSIIVLLSPIYVSDKRNHVRLLQYTSKKGRSVFTTKLMTALISTFLLITVQLIGYFTIYSQNQVHMFFASKVNSIFNYVQLWYDLSFFQYIVMTVVAIYLLGIILSLIVCFISSISSNYLMVIGMQVPIFLGLVGYLLKYLIENVTTLRLPKYLAPSLYLALLFIGIIFMILRWKKEKVLDIV